MILVRMVFQVEWGKAQEAVQGFAHAAELFHRIAGSAVHHRILTDLSGPFNTVVQEIEVESLAEWERVRAALFSAPEFQERMASQPMPVVSGSQEFYTIEATL